MPSPLQQMMANMMRDITGAKPGTCPTCGSDKVTQADFRDELSWREYNISQMCQKCQDGVFGTG